MTDPILLTPGPLTTSAATKAAMQSDWGSWDSAFNSLTATVCTALISGMRALGLRTFLPDALQAPIIVTFHAPNDAAYDFGDFYRRVRDRGFTAPAARPATG